MYVGMGSYWTTLYFFTSSLPVFLSQLESAGAGAVDASMSMVDGGSILGGAGMKGAETPDVAKFSVRLKEAYKERINYYREAIYLLTG